MVVEANFVIRTRVGNDVNGGHRPCKCEADVFVNLDVEGQFIKNHCGVFNVVMGGQHHGAGG